MFRGLSSQIDLSEAPARADKRRTMEDSKLKPISISRYTLTILLVLIHTASKAIAFSPSSTSCWNHIPLSFASPTSSSRIPWILRASSTATNNSNDNGKANSNTDDDSIALEKATKAMTAFTNKYLSVSKTKLCADKSVPAVVIQGLAEHKVAFGTPLCPCRFYEDKEAEVKDGYWNCPCVPMRERQECHCMLFLTDESPFVGEETSIGLEEVRELTGAVVAKEKGEGGDE